MKYEVYFDDKYINGFFHTGNPLRDIYELSNEILESEFKNCWYLEDGVFLFDEDKKRQIIFEREEEAKKPTTQDIIEAQVTYTALMTDTLLPEEE